MIEFNKNFNNLKNNYLFADIARKTSEYKKENPEKNIIKLENWLEKNYPGISRGIYRKKGKGVNGVYNQDFSENCFLIEVGGEENNYEEVENTLDVIAEMLNYYLEDNDD